MGRRIHMLKTWPAPFQALVDGTKTFEVRLNDRDYKVGDWLHLVAWDPDAGKGLGVSAHAPVRYVLHGGRFGIEKDHVVMGLGEVRMGEPATDWKPATLEEVETKAQRIARAVEVMTPQGWGFAVLHFPMNRPGHVTYISNGTREDMSKAMGALVEKWRTGAAEY